MTGKRCGRLAANRRLLVLSATIDAAVPAADRDAAWSCSTTIPNCFPTISTASGFMTCRNRWRWCSGIRRIPIVWGLKNLSPVKWVMTAPDGTIRDVEPGRSVTLAAGVKVNFGPVEGEIRI